METKWTKEKIKELLLRNDKAVCKGLIAIYNNQTSEEQACQETYCKNGIGFNGVDANILSSFAEFYKERGYLSSKQLEIARKKMLKYSNQLLSLVVSK